MLKFLRPDILESKDMTAFQPKKYKKEVFVEVLPNP